MNPRSEDCSQPPDGRDVEPEPVACGTGRPERTARGATAGPAAGQLEAEPGPRPSSVPTLPPRLVLTWWGLHAPLAFGALLLGSEGEPARQAGAWCALALVLVLGLDSLLVPSLSRTISEKGCGAQIMASALIAVVAVVVLLVIVAIGLAGIRGDGLPQ